tara:strand:- start:5852 stop:6391 length:540 start_codon:yes stop_codon:yes gene_type:complete
MKEDLLDRLSKIKIVVSDVDGILTDGTIIISKDQEFKTFHVEDALGTRLLELADIPISFISARESEATSKRLNELKIKNVYQGYLNKLHALDKILKIYNLKKKDVLYIGDGYVDMPVMEEVGFSISVPNAHDEVKSLADFVTEKSGGQGVMVEVAKYVLKSKGIYNQVFSQMKKYIYEA